MVGLETHRAPVLAEVAVIRSRDPGDRMKRWGLVSARRVCM